MKKPAYLDKDERELAKSLEEGIPYQSLVSMLIPQRKSAIVS